MAYCETLFLLVLLSFVFDDNLYSYRTKRMGVMWALSRNSYYAQQTFGCLVEISQRDQDFRLYQLLHCCPLSCLAKQNNVYYMSLCFRCLNLTSSQSKQPKPNMSNIINMKHRSRRRKACGFVPIQVTFFNPMLSFILVFSEKKFNFSDLRSSFCSLVLLAKADGERPYMANIKSHPSLHQIYLCVSVCTTIQT